MPYNYYKRNKKNIDFFVSIIILGNKTNKDFEKLSFNQKIDKLAANFYVSLGDVWELEKVFDEKYIITNKQREIK